MMLATPSPAFAEIPDWYCHLAMRREVTFIETLMAVMHWMINLAWRPTWRLRSALPVILRPLRHFQFADPVAVEMLSFWASVWFLVYVWRGPLETRAQAALHRMASTETWITAAIICIALQAIVWLRWRAVERSVALLLLAGWWAWVSYCFARIGFLSSLIVLPGLALLCLVASQVVDRLGGHNNGQT